MAFDVRKNWRVLLKAGILLLFLAGTLWLITRPQAQAYLDRAAIQSLVSSHGVWGPVLIIALHAIGTTLLIPSTVFVIASALLFGTWWGFLFALIGATLGASLSFLLARTLGRDLARQFVKGRMRTYDDALERNGFAAILYLRLLLAPFAIINYASGLTKIRFRDYALATLIGIAPSILILTYFVNQVAVTQFSDLLRWQVFVAAGLFALSFFLPLLLRKRFRM